MRFWESEDTVLAQLYGVVAIDPAAKDFVERQRSDRRGELERLVRNIQRSGHMRKGIGPARALSQLLVLTSYETVKELQQAGQSGRETIRLLQENGRTLLLADDD